MKWKCVVCGYIANADQPPSSCPICHAGASKFVEEAG